jgi:hypothetical protein
MADDKRLARVMAFLDDRLTIEELAAFIRVYNGPDAKALGADGAPFRLGFDVPPRPTHTGD